MKYCASTVATLLISEAHSTRFRCEVAFAYRQLSRYTQVRRGSSIQFRLVPKLILIRYLNLPNLILMRNLNLILLLILNSNRGTLNPKSSKLDCRLDIAAKHPGRTSGKWVTHPLGTLVPGHLGPYGRSAPASVSIF